MRGLMGGHLVVAAILVARGAEGDFAALRPMASCSAERFDRLAAGLIRTSARALQLYVMLGISFVAITTGGLSP